MNSDIRLDKLKKEISLELEGVPSMKGYVFLNKHSPEYHRTERVSDLLGNEDFYFPFQKKGGQILIIRKAAVLRIVLEASFELEIIRSYGSQGVIMTDVVVTLTDGKKVKGSLLIEPREAFSRPSDELNRDKDFLMLLSGKTVQIFGTRHVAYVQELGNKKSKKQN